MKVSEDLLGKARFTLYAAFKLEKKDDKVIPVIDMVEDGVIICSVSVDGAVCQMLRDLNKINKLTDEDKTMPFILIEITFKSKDVHDKLSDYFNEEPNGLIDVRFSDLLEDHMNPNIDENVEFEQFSFSTFFGVKDSELFEMLTKLARSSLNLEMKFKSMHMTNFDAYEDNIGRLCFADVTYEKNLNLSLFYN